MIRDFNVTLEKSELKKTSLLLFQSLWAFRAKLCFLIKFID